MATLARLNVILGLQSNEFTRSLRRAQRSVKRFGAQAERAGRVMTTAITAPLVAAGAAAVKFATEFDTAFKRIEGLVGVAGDEVAEFREEVLKMAVEVGKAPLELAEAMFDITSAGFEGAAAVDALRASAQAAAAGLGETRTVADAVTNAVNAYGAANLSAAQSSAILVATVREGKASAESLAPVIGQLATPAEELGIRFDEMGAGLAALTRTTGNAALAATQLKAIFKALIRPGAQAADVLESVGLSTEKLQTKIREDGLLATLKLLRERFKDNTAGLGKAFESFEAVSGILALTKDEAKAAEEIFAALARTTEDDLKTAFEKTEGPAREFGRIMATIQAAAIRLGDAILPILTPIIQNLAKIVERASEAFGSLPEPMKRILIAIAALAAAAGPILFIIGGIATGIAAIGSTIGIWAAVIAAVGALIVSNFDLISGAVNRVVKDAKPALKAFGDFILVQWGKVRKTALEIWPYVSDTISKVAKTIKEIWERFGPVFLAIVAAQWGRFKAIVDVAVDLVLGVIKGFVQFMARDFSGLGETILEVGKKLRDKVGPHFKLFTLGVKGAFISMRIGVLEQIQAIIDKTLAWATVASDLVFLNPAARNAARAAIATIGEQFGGIGTAIESAKVSQQGVNDEVAKLKKELGEGNRKVVQFRSEWYTAQGVIAETAITVRDKFGVAIDATTTQLKGGLGAAADEFLVKMDETKETLESTPWSIEFVPIIDWEQLQRDAEEHGVTPATGGFTGP